MRFKRSILTGVTLAASLPLLVGMGQPPMPLAQGQLAMRLGQYDKARSLFSEAAPANPEARYWQGEADARLGHAEDAIATWQQAMADPRVGTQAASSLDRARNQLQTLVNLLDRYSSLQAGAANPDAWRALGGQFDSLARDAASTLSGRRAALMAADCFANAGDTSDALGRFEAAKDQLPLVADWALWRMATIDPGRGDEYLQILVAQYPDSPLLLSAKVTLAEHEQDPDRRRQLLVSVVNDGDTQPAAERALYLLAKEAGEHQAGYLVKYWNTYPDGKYLDEVVHALAKLPGLSADTNYRIGSYFYFQSDYGPATTFFNKVRSPMALYRMGRAYWGLDDLNRAVAMLKTVINTDSSLAGQAFLTIGQVESQRGHTAQAIAAYQQSAKYGGEAGVTARWKLAKIYRDQHKTALAASLEKGIITNSPWSEEATDILWQNFWNAYQAHRYTDAIVSGRSLAKHHATHITGMAAQYWLGRIYERMGDNRSASASYQGLVGRSPSTYYGWRAQWRLQALSGRGQDPWFSTRPDRDVQEPPIRWADLLGSRERSLLAGAAGTALPKEMLDWPESVRELVFLRQFGVAEQFAADSKSPNLKAWVSFLQMHYRQAIREEKGEPRLSYPLGFAPMLIAAAHQQGVDPLLLAALVREESRFDPGAKSWVGAVGLAQLMPDTASWVAKNVPAVAGNPLSDPLTNLQLGAWYLAHTHKVFNGGSMYAVAAYNGGPGAVSRWRKLYGGDPDEFVERIPYAETRLYVMKVFSSYWNYVKLYG